LVKDWPAEKKRIEDNWKKERKVKKWKWNSGPVMQNI
jgi:hypothetical protein